MHSVLQTMPDDWQEDGVNDRDSPSPPLPHSRPHMLPLSGKPQEYVYGSSDEEDEEGEGMQGEIQVN